MRDHAFEVVAPHIQKILVAEFDSNAAAFRLELSENGEQMRLHYPSVLEASGLARFQGKFGFRCRHWNDGVRGGAAP